MMRKRIWYFVRRKIPEGMILPRWALIVRATLFPLDFFYWWMSQQTGYQCQTDTWLIDGVEYSGRSLFLLSNAHGEAYRVSRTGKTVTLELVRPACPVIGDRVKATMNREDWFIGTFVEEIDSIAPYGVLRDDTEEVRFFIHVEKLNAGA